MDNIVCIYRITNTITGDFYIGQTINFKMRMKAHKKKPAPKMREDVEKYGWDAFKFEIIEECTADNLTERENYYIRNLNPAYNTMPWGYEITEETRKKISQANLGKKISPETRDKISRAKKGKKFSLEHCKKIQKRMRIQAVDLFGKAVVCIETQEVFESMVEAANKLSIKPQNLSAALHGRQKTAGGYTWKYVDETLNSSENVKIQSVNRKLILCVETGEIFHSITKAAEKKNTTFKGISNVLHGRAITSGGYHWKYADEQLNDEIRDETNRRDNKKPVICVETGEVFQSIADAAKHLGILAQGISDVLRGIKVTSGGYHWKYADGRPDKTREKKSQKIISQPVLCIETGEIFPSVKEAIAFANVSRSTFFSALRNLDKTAGKFHFKRIDDRIEKKEIYLNENLSHPSELSCSNAPFSPLFG